MATKHEVCQQVLSGGLVLIVRLPSASESLAVARAAIEGGITAIEITLTTPGALSVIGELADEFGSTAVIGAGTVLDENSAYASIQAGARLLVSPNLNPAMIRTANRYGVATISGAFTPSEFVATMEAGADFVKLFPTEAASPAYAKSLLAPLPWAPLIPAGGVSVANVDQWFEAGVSAVGVGSAITKAGVGGDLSLVTQAAREFVSAVAKARK